MAIRPDGSHVYLLKRLSQVCTTKSLNHDVYTGKTDHFNTRFVMLLYLHVYIQIRFVTDTTSRKSVYDGKKQHASKLRSMMALFRRFSLLKIILFSRKYIPSGLIHTKEMLLD